MLSSCHSLVITRCTIFPCALFRELLMLFFIKPMCTIRKKIKTNKVSSLMSYADKIPMYQEAYMSTRKAIALSWLELRDNQVCVPFFICIYRKWKENYSILLIGCYSKCIRYNCLLNTIKEQDDSLRRILSVDGVLVLYFSK